MSLSPVAQQWATVMQTLGVEWQSANGVHSDFWLPEQFHWLEIASYADADNDVLIQRLRRIAADTKHDVILLAGTPDVHRTTYRARLVGTDGPIATCEWEVCPLCGKWGLVADAAFLPCRHLRDAWERDYPRWAWAMFRANEGPRST